MLGEYHEEPTSMTKCDTPDEIDSLDFLLNTIHAIPPNTCLDIILETKLRLITTSEMDNKPYQISNYAKNGKLDEFIAYMQAQLNDMRDVDENPYQNVRVHDFNEIRSYVSSFQFPRETFDALKRDTLREKFYLALTDVLVIAFEEDLNPEFEEQMTLKLKDDVSNIGLPNEFLRENDFTSGFAAYLVSLAKIYRKSIQKSYLDRGMIRDILSQFITLIRTILPHQPESEDTRKHYWILFSTYITDIYSFLRMIKRIHYRDDNTLYYLFKLPQYSSDGKRSFISKFNSIEEFNTYCTENNITGVPYRWDGKNIIKLRQGYDTRFMAYRGNNKCSDNPRMQNIIYYGGAAHVFNMKYMIFKMSQMQGNSLVCTRYVDNATDLNDSENRTFRKLTDRYLCVSGLNNYVFWNETNGPAVVVINNSTGELTRLEEKKQTDRDLRAARRTLVRESGAEGVKGSRGAAVQYGTEDFTLLVRRLRQGEIKLNQAYGILTHRVRNQEHLKEAVDALDRIVSQHDTELYAFLVSQIRDDKLSLEEAKDILSRDLYDSSSAKRYIFQIMDTFPPAKKKNRLEERDVTPVVFFPEEKAASVPPLPAPLPPPPPPGEVDLDQRDKDEFMKLIDDYVAGRITKEDAKSFIEQHFQPKNKTWSKLLRGGSRRSRKIKRKGYKKRSHKYSKTKNRKMKNK